MPPANFSRNGGTFGSYVQMSGSEVSKILAGPQGPLAKGLMVVGNRAKRNMMRLSPVYDPPPAGPKRKRRPGTLRDSHLVRLSKGPGGGLVVLVGSDDFVALLVVKGTSPHPIVARRAPMLVFYSKKHGKVVFRKRVNHPGTAPNDYMIRATREAVASL